MMSYCFGCGSNFSFFKKEHSCTRCGRLHCSKCLIKKVVLPSSEVAHDICKRCLDDTKKVQPSNRTDQSQIKRGGQEPPPPYPGGTEITKSQSQPQVGNHQSDPDLEIRQRLDRLKENAQEGTANYSEKSINEKFALLTGKEPVSAKSNDILAPRPKLSDEEEVKRLMESAMAEASLEDKQPESAATKTDIRGLEDRLLKLKGVDPESVRTSEADNDSSEDEGEATAKVVKKALAEARIDDKMHAEGYGHLVDSNKGVSENELHLPAVPSHTVSWRPSLGGHNDDTEQELPWCCICNADASLRCHGCDDDLYCRRCYKEGHSDFGMTDHQTSPFKTRPKR